MKKEVLIGIAMVSVVGISSSVYLVSRNRNRDKKSAEFIDELDAKLNPTTSGIDNDDALNQNYHEHSDQSNRLDMDSALEFAQNIYDAWGQSWWEDDKEKQVYSALRNLDNKTQLSQVASAYYDQYKVGLREDIKDRMSDSEVSQVMEIINQLKD
jgi:flagellar motility protein MotE (MotC chaperone)